MCPYSVGWVDGVEAPGRRRVEAEMRQAVQTLSVLCVCARGSPRDAKGRGGGGRRRRTMNSGPARQNGIQQLFGHNFALVFFSLVCFNTSSVKAKVGQPFWNSER